LEVRVELTESARRQPLLEKHLQHVELLFRTEQRKELGDVGRMDLAQRVSQLPPGALSHEAQK
jgi:hypothetical protein